MDIGDLLRDDTSLSLDTPSLSSLLNSDDDTYIISKSSSETTETQHSDDETYNANVKKLDSVLKVLNDHLVSFWDSSLALQRKRDFFLLSIHLLKHNDIMEELSETDQEDIRCYLQSIRTRLSSVEVNIGRFQKSNSIKRIDEMINDMICSGDVALIHKGCEHYLNDLYSLINQKDIRISTESNERSNTIGKKPFEEMGTEFRNLLLGCTENDRENIRKRLLALINHVNFQMSNTSH